MPEPALSVFVRATLPLGATTPAFVEPTPLSVGEAPDRPDDFIPLRPALDLVLTGLVDMAGVPQGGVFVRRAAISIGEAREELLIASGAPGRVPLAPPYTRWLDGSEARLGPRPLTSAVPADGIHPDGFDFDAYQIGADRLQFDGMPAGEPLVLQGFFAEGDRVETLLPDLAPRLLVDLAEPGLEPRDVVLRLDTAHVDCDRRVVDLTWRGLLALEGEVRAATDRLIVGWVRPTEWDDSRVASPLARHPARAPPRALLLGDRAGRRGAWGGPARSHRGGGPHGPLSELGPGRRPAGHPPPRAPRAHRRGARGAA
jgi:hypothetical protein